MITVLIDAALRSLLVGLIVASGLRVFRVRNAFAQKVALDLVLVGALIMPFLMPITDRLQLLPAHPRIVLPANPMTLLEELQARIQAKSGSGKIPRPIATGPIAASPFGAPIPAAPSPKTEKASTTAPKTASAPRVNEPEPSNSQSKAAQRTPLVGGAQTGQQMQTSPSSHRAAFSLAALALEIYIAVAALLLLRLALGLAVTLRLWVTALPIRAHELVDSQAGLSLRTSRRVSSPLTIGSAILLPADYPSWDKEKLRIVLAHERSHVRQGDFYLQLLAGLYAALVWVSPLGWWLKRELADLAEAISDRAGIEQARSRTSYAQILLEFASRPRPTALGVAMARPGSLTRRIERLLNDNAFCQSFAGGRSALFAVVLVPMLLFLTTAMVRVEAATGSAPVTWIAPVSMAHAPRSVSAASAKISEPPAIRLAQLFSVGHAAENNVEVRAMPDASLEAEASAVPTSEIAAAQGGPNLFPVRALARVAVVQSESDGSLSFDRTLSVSGDAQLTVTTGSGDIHLTQGSGSQIHIHGRIHVNRGGSEQQAREIAANPPIEQSGSVIRVGQNHEEHWRGISIDYQIEAPSGTVLEARSGSGDIVDDGVGRNVKLETGSGDIRAKGLEGSFVVKTGSGNITAEQIGQGDGKAETGSGDVEIKGLNGSLHAQTGSGDIKATGRPSGPWTLETGSGNVEIWSGNAPMTLDGSTGSGSVTTDHEMLVKGSLNQHHITGNLNGGGPLVRVQTGSGDVRVH
jgi:beta-lactamase regulating signal transducer with metallopeptidase domain